MVQPGAPNNPHDAARTTTDLAALYADCFEAFRRRAPHAVWLSLNQRILELQDRVEKQYALACDCTFCRCKRRRPTLRILAFREPGSRSGSPGP